MCVQMVVSLRMYVETFLRGDGTSKAAVSEQTELALTESYPTRLTVLFPLYVHIYTPELLLQMRVKHVTVHKISESS